MLTITIRKEVVDLMAAESIKAQVKQILENKPGLEISASVSTHYEKEIT